MPEPLLVVVGGMPGAGKSSLARRLGDALHLPVVHRDAIKTGIHVTHRSVDPVEQRRFAESAFDLAFHTTRVLLDGGSSVVLEAAFHRARSGPPLIALARGCTARWIWTRCSPEVALARYSARSRRGERHPAHNDPSMLGEMSAVEFDWTRYDPPPEVDPAAVRWVDTEDGCVPSVEELAVELAAIVRS